MINMHRPETTTDEKCAPNGHTGCKTLFLDDLNIQEIKNLERVWHQPVKHGRNLSVLVGRPVRIRFTLTNGSLYAFWLSV